MNRYRYYIFIFFIFISIFFVGCTKKKIDTEISSSDSLEIIEEVEDEDEFCGIDLLEDGEVKNFIPLGFHFLFNTEKIKFYKDNIFSTCNFIYNDRIETEDEDNAKKFKVDRKYLSKLASTLHGLYLNDDWCLTELIYDNIYILFEGIKDQRHLSVLVINENNKVKVHSSIYEI